MTKKHWKNWKKLEGADIIEKMMTASEQVNSQDDVIAEKARLGDKESQDYLLHKYKNLVKKIAMPYNIVGGDTQDILQEGMIGLYKAIRDFERSKGIYFHVFAKTCINRQIINAIRSANRKKHGPLNNSISLDAEKDEKEDFNQIALSKTFESKDPETIFLLKERSELLEQKLKEILTEKELQVLYLYVEGYSYAEMATKVGITAKGISSTIQRIKRKLLTRCSNIL